MPSGDAADRARAALLARLRELLPANRAETIDGDGRTECFEDNLVHLEPWQVDELRSQLEAGDGGELRPSQDGRRPSGHSAYSSATLAFNAFGRWLGSERLLRVCGVAHFEPRLRIEARCRIFRGGRAPNLDCLLLGPHAVMGVESKLTETLARHRTPEWSNAYGRADCRALVSGGWLEVLDLARRQLFVPQYLNAAQLLKHALGLAKQYGPQAHLAYVYWEPTNASDFDVVRSHRKEVLDFAERIAGSPPFFHAISYADLLDEWAACQGPEWLPEHIEALRTRYELEI